MRNGVSGIYANRLSNILLVSGFGLFIFCLFILDFMLSIRVINEGFFLIMISTGMSFGLMVNGVYFHCRPVVNVDDDYLSVKLAAARPSIKVHHDNVLYMTRHKRHYEVSYQSQSKSKVKRYKLPYKYFDANGLAQLHSLAMSYFH